MSTVELRRALPSDAVAISELHARSFRNAYQCFPESQRSIQTGAGRRVAFWKNNLARRDETTLVAFVEDSLVGFVRFGPAPEDDSDESTGHVFSVHVAPEHTGSGVGSRLVEAGVADMAARFETATLWALRDNESVHRFYERLGWRRDGTSRTEKLSIGDDDGDDVEVMRLRLDLAARVEGTE